MNDKPMYKKGSFGARFGAYSIDLLIIFALSITIGTYLNPFNISENLIDVILPLLYGVLFVWQKGATPGKMLLRIKIVNESYQPIGLKKALLRETIGKILSGIVFSLGFLWMLLDKKNQTWHDKIAKTYVVQTKKDGELIESVTNETITIKRKISFSVLLFINAIPFLFIINYLFFFRPFQINGDAMNPHYKNGQHYLSQVTQGPFKRGDVIILKAPHEPNKDFIKRVIGLPGENVMLNNGNVYINNSILNESSYIGLNTKTFGGEFLQEGQTVSVPANSYFVLGDNRPYSSDSREWGFVPQENVVSKMLFCYWGCE